MAEIDAKLAEQLKQAEPTAEEAFQKIAEGKKKKKGDRKVRSSMTQILNNTTLKNKKMKSFDATGYSETALEDADPTFIDPSIMIN